MPLLKDRPLPSAKKIAAYSLVFYAATSGFATPTYLDPAAVKLEPLTALLPVEGVFENKEKGKIIVLKVSNKHFRRAVDMGFFPIENRTSGAKDDPQQLIYAYLPDDPKARPGTPRKVFGLPVEWGLYGIFGDEVFYPSPTSRGEVYKLHVLDEVSAAEPARLTFVCASQQTHIFTQVRGIKEYFIVHAMEKSAFQLWSQMPEPQGHPADPSNQTPLTTSIRTASIGSLASIPPAKPDKKMDGRVPTRPEFQTPCFDPNGPPT